MSKYNEIENLAEAKRGWIGKEKLKWKPNKSYLASANGKLPMRMPKKDKKRKLYTN